MSKATPPLLKSLLDPCASEGGQHLPLGGDGEPVFAEPWQAEAFATTVQLHGRGLFTWKQWVEVFSREISNHPQRDDEGAADAYFRQWLAALETMLAKLRLASVAEIAHTHEHWRRSYINTEHGQAVMFSRDWGPVSAEVERELEHSHHHDHDDDDVAPTPIAVSPPRAPIRLGGAGGRSA